MNFRKSFKEIFAIGEERSFTKMTEIISLGKDANSLIIEMLTKPHAKLELETENEGIKTLERHSDELAFALSNEITRGAISSNVLDDLLQCVKIADDILDNYYYISREIARMERVELESAGQKGFTEDFNSLFLKMLGLADEAMDLLQKLLSSSDTGEISELRKRIESVEEAGDDVKDHAFDKLYAIAHELHYIQFFHISDLLHKLDGILDACEDLSDLAVAIIGSISK